MKYTKRQHTLVQVACELKISTKQQTFNREVAPVILLPAQTRGALVLVFHQDRCVCHMSTVSTLLYLYSFTPLMDITPPITSHTIY